MSFLWMLLIGLIVGAVAKFLTPGRDPQGCLVTMLLGVVGAMLAGFLGRSAGWYAEGEPVGFIASVVGAILVLLVFRLIKGKS
ncbi:MAG: GlsB/YeaQ/YmgE family stress response membrane protein [Prosthecobacter sp.]|nr:GlsB/YeaQ/YmgE family stress response membrane protein [Prosthecobacter sp.]